MFYYFNHALLDKDSILKLHWRTTDPQGFYPETVTTHRGPRATKQSTVFGRKKLGDQSDASQTRKQDLTLDQEQDQNTKNTKTQQGTTVQ